MYLLKNEQSNKRPQNGSRRKGTLCRERRGVIENSSSTPLQESGLEGSRNLSTHNRFRTQRFGRQVTITDWTWGLKKSTLYIGNVSFVHPSNNVYYCGSETGSGEQSLHGQMIGCFLVLWAYIILTQIWTRTVNSEIHWDGGVLERGGKRIKRCRRKEVFIHLFFREKYFMNNNNLCVLNSKKNHPHLPSAYDTCRFYYNKF